MAYIEIREVKKNGMLVATIERTLSGMYIVAGIVDGHRKKFICDTLKCAKETAKKEF